MLPEPSDRYDWIAIDGRRALVCRPLAELAPHFFTTREWPIGAGGRGDWTAVANAAGVPQLLRLTQVHRAGFVVHRRGAALPGGLPAADIVVSDDPAVAVAVQAADCVPLLLADRRLGVVAAAHAGWRGLAAGVPGVTVRALAEAFGSRPDDLVVAVGPSIGACCYEVGADVRAAFDGAPAEGWFHAEPPRLAANPPFRDLRPTPGRLYFDGWASARDQLLSAGVPREQVHVAALCTASHAGTFCSYRREGAAAGRIAGVIRVR